MKRFDKTASTSIADLLSTAGRHPPVYIDGGRWAHLCRNGTATQRALAAHALATGAVIITRLLGTQANKLAGANSRYASLANHLTTAQAFNLGAGLYPMGRLAQQAQAPDRKADRAVAKLGPARLQAALDRANAIAPTGHARRNGGNGSAHLPAGSAFER